MTQESSDDMNSKFSGLNVHAMEFVPSFCVPGGDEDESPVSAEAPAIVPDVPPAPAVPPNTVPVAVAAAPSTNSSSNNNGTCRRRRRPMVMQHIPLYVRPRLYLM